MKPTAPKATKPRKTTPGFKASPPSVVAALHVAPKVALARGASSAIPFPPFLPAQENGAELWTPPRSRGGGSLLFTLPQSQNRGNRPWPLPTTHGERRPIPKTDLNGPMSACHQL